MNINVATCLLCGDTAELRYGEYPGYQEPATYKIYHCRHCNTAFSLPRADASSIYENIYNNADRVPGYNRYLRYARFVKKFAEPLKYLADSAEAYWGVKEALSQLVIDNKAARILEIGSGLGYFTFALVKAGYNAKGIDISETAVSQAKESFGNYYICNGIAEYATNNAELYDIVIFTEVIEHVDDPQNFLALALTLLKPGGQAIITTPNKSFFTDDITWASDLPPVHSWWFSEESVKYIAKSINADIKFVSFSKYYKKNYKVVGLKSQRDGRLPCPYFNKDGRLIARTARSKNTLKVHLQVLLSRIPFGTMFTDFFKKYLKMLFGKLRVLIEKDTIVCKDRGILLCAIIQKPPDKKGHL
ncbi:MAG: methyltransferase domain-containing protein [Bacteroidales bacterium]|nr:methyltransferase domain-containing protein [Bacteroidales bacterium]